MSVNSRILTPFTMSLSVSYIDISTVLGTVSNICSLLALCDMLKLNVIFLSLVQKTQTNI